MEKVKDIMTREPACCAPTASLHEAAKMLCDFDCGELPVINKEGKPVGVITDRDITCRAVAKGVNPAEAKVEEHMSTPCVTVSLEAGLEECCRILEEHQIRRVPVVDAEGKCCGIVAQADIALKAPSNKTSEVLKEVSKSSA